MSWASQRRTSYAFGVIIFFILIIGGPIAYWYFNIPATCFDGIQNQGETTVDKGGPCALLDVHTLTPETLLWARAFRVRDGSYNAVAYIQNQNVSAGVLAASYRFGLYDANNILVAEARGTTPIMPGSVTPVFSGAVDTGNRVVTHTYFEFTAPLTWERASDTSGAIDIHDVSTTDTQTVPRVSAIATNTSVKTLKNLTYIATIFDPAGNAFAASQTALDQIAPGADQTITFTWPSPFLTAVGRVDIKVVTAPASI